MRIYLAGPDVFHRDALSLSARKKALCEGYGFRGLYPLDRTPPPGRPPSPNIYAICRAMIDEADCGLFNLTPFRGASADVGTVMELGLMVAQAKPVFAYTNAAEDLIDRLRVEPGLVRDAATNLWRDPLGLMAEDFGNADNLMLDESLGAQGRKIHRFAIPLAQRFENMNGVVACLEELRRSLNGVPAT